MAARDCLKNAVANPCNHLIDSAVDGVLSYSVNSLYIPLSQSLHDGAGHRFVGPILCCNPLSIPEEKIIINLNFTILDLRRHKIKLIRYCHENSKTI